MLKELLNSQSFLKGPSLKEFSRKVYVFQEFVVPLPWIIILWQ